MSGAAAHGAAGRSRDTAPERVDPRPVLAVNAGSSSLKFGLYPATGPACFAGEASGLEPGGRPRWRLAGGPEQALDIEPQRTVGALPALGGEGPAVAAAAQAAGASEGAGAAGAFDAALQRLQATVVDHAPQGLLAVAHRIVHGGAQGDGPQVLDDAALARLAALSPLAPLHQPHNLDGVRALRAAFPDVPQIGCFDTAFHAGQPEVERLLPLPPARTEAAGLRRYGFHGLSYAYLAGELSARSARWAGGRALLAHLGNGASLCAVHDGRSVASTMGFSALDGLMMGTRSGSLDAGVLLYLLAHGDDAASLERLLYRESGLKGVSGLSADMRALHAAAAQGHAGAQRALALFARRLLREAGALTAVLGGLDLLAFTGGIGEHDAVVRAGLVEGLAFLGLRLDAQANRAATGDAVCRIDAADSRTEIWVVPTDEGRVAARQARALCAASGPERPRAA
ncbi:MAG: hypothetical protein RIQ53_3513 [Pseudomonadota bacterium]|jgi:acetate kinase